MKNAGRIFLGTLLIHVLAAAPLAAQQPTNADLNERIERLEEKIAKKETEQRWTERMTISGAIEAEASLVNLDYDDPEAEDADESDIVLATVELGIDAEIHEHVSGHLLLLWEEDDTDPIDMDEGFITLDGRDRLPLYLNIGKFYLPFGNYESHMITDPATLELGEINQSALQVGFASQRFNASLSLFNGDVDEQGEDDAIASYVGSIQFNDAEGMFPNLGVAAGVSYISNLADSDGLGNEITAADGTIVDHVGGLGLYVNLSYKEMFFLKAEYVTALDEFEAADLNIAGGSEIAPSAWNLEVAYAPLEKLEVAARYAQSDDINGGIDVAGAYPERQYGAAVGYTFLDNTAVALEYLWNEYQNDDTASMFSTQLAIEF